MYDKRLREVVNFSSGRGVDIRQKGGDLEILHWIYFVPICNTKHCDIGSPSIPTFPFPRVIAFGDVLSYFVL